MHTRNKLPQITKQYLLEEIFVNNSCISHIAIKNGCSRGAIWRRLKWFNIYNNKTKHQILENQRKNPNYGMTGKKMTFEQRKKHSMSVTGKDKFDGFVTPESVIARNSDECLEWKKRVAKKFNYKCAVTGENDGDLVIHHLYSFNKYPELRFMDENGVLIKNSIHKDFHDSYGYGNNTPRQFEEYLQNIPSVR